MNQNFYCKTCTPWDRSNWHQQSLPEYANYPNKITFDKKINVEITLPFQQNNFLSSLTFYEKVSKNLCLTLLNSGKINKNIKYPLNDLYYDNIIVNSPYEHLKLYTDKNIDDIVPVRFKKYYHWGRVFEENGLTLCSIPGQMTRSLIKDEYYDFDIISSGPNILRNICEMFKIDCSAIKYVANNKDKIIKELIDYYGLPDNKDGKYIAKDIIYVNIYNGDVEDMNKVYKMYNLDVIKPVPELIVKFRNNIIDVRRKLIQSNPILWNFCKSNFQNVRNKKFGETENLCGRGSMEGYFMSLYLQEYEFRIVSGILEFLYSHTNLLKYKGRNGVFIYEYDGFFLLKENIDEQFGGPKKVLKLLRDKTKELFGFDLEWKLGNLNEKYIDLEKEISQFYTMDPALYNVLNGCWLCNYDKQNLENDYLMDRSFFNGICGPPCNKPDFFIPPINSKNQLK